jgi:thiazole synthase ThiGH ThiG subunit
MVGADRILQRTQWLTDDHPVRHVQAFPSAVSAGQVADSAL